MIDYNIPKGKRSEIEEEMGHTGGLVLDRETLSRYLPKGVSAKLTDEVLDMLNNVELATGVDQDLFNEQICSYAHLIKNGAGIEKLANAIKYVNLRMLPKMGNAKAWEIVFPDKAKEIRARGQNVDSFASMYNSSKLVVEVQKLVMVPVNISHAPVHNAMLKKLFDLTNGIGAKEGDYVSPTVQMGAAVELLKATAMPEDTNMNITVGLNEEAKTFQKSVMEQIAQVAAQQRDRLTKGESIQDVQQLGISFNKKEDEEVIDV
jgi:hypothetical protein